MTQPTNDAPDIQVVTAPDFAAPRSGTVLAILGGEDFKSEILLQEIQKRWEQDDPLTVYVQPITNGADFTRALAIASMSDVVIVQLDEEVTSELVIMATVRTSPVLVFANGVHPETAHALTSIGVTVMHQPGVVVDYAGDHAVMTPR